MVEERLYEPQERIWEQLSGKRIVLAGIENRERQFFCQNLAGIRAQLGANFTVLDGTEHVSEGDYVLLFGRPSWDGEDDGSLECAGADCGNQGKSVRSHKQGSRKWDVPASAWQCANTSWEETFGLLSQLEAVGRAKPGSILLVSGNEVYGKSFGMPHARAEEELGYVCHTNSLDVPAQCLRTEEHFACQLAREEAFPMKIARMGALPTGEAAGVLLTAAMQALIYGEDGEIYNLPGGEEYSLQGDPAAVPDEGENGALSPLEPLPVVTDARKLESLRR